VLWITGTEVTDAGLKELGNYKGLTKVYLKRTRVTDAGVAELLRNRPGLKIDR